jgi:hypothetical protein
MSKIVEIKEGQSVWDLAIQHHGSIEGVAQLLLDNPSLDLQNTPVQGSLIVIDETKMVDKDVVNYLQEKGAVPANSVQAECSAFSKGFTLGFE